MPSAARRRPAARALPFALTASALALSLALPALAQTAAPQRVEITGSAIKRIDGETALPVQVITREEIDKAGLTTAAEIVARVAAATNNLTDGVSIGTGGYHDQMGMNSANLRGMGASSTLVLLNGRRMANFASPGDNVGVDLNNIPAAAIERVEVLLDGASALYGSDAIGGVLNFITRRDYQGLEINASVGATTEGGAGKRSASLAGGVGDFGRDGFNVFGVLDLQTTSRLDASQRRFIDDLKIPERLPHLLSSAPWPANLRLTGLQRDHLADRGFTVGGEPITERVINLSRPGCNPPSSLPLPSPAIGGSQGCTYDYMRDLELYPKSDKLSAFGRGVLALGSGHQLFGEVALSRSRTYYTGTPNRTDVEVHFSKIPGLENTALDQAVWDPDEDDDPQWVTVRTRLPEAGNRTSELVSTGQRLVAGLSGAWGAWDYEVALNHSTNRVSDRDHNGYLNEAIVHAGIQDGVINAFGPSGAAGLQMLADAQIRGEVRRATGTMDSFDFKGSRSLGKFGAGDALLALGGELRRESQTYHQSQALADDLIMGEVSQGPDADFGNSRRVGAVWGELLLTPLKNVDVQLAMRHERYQGTGSATSPKLGVKWGAAPTLALRGSVATGFRAPSMSDLYRPVTESESATLADPVCMAENDNDLTYCAWNWTTRSYANAQLKPEKSRQFSLGALYEPSRHFNMSVDYWNVEKRDLISAIGVDVILKNLDKYEGLVHRYGEDEGLCDFYEDDIDICFIELRKANRGKQKLSGLDIALSVSGIKSEIGTFGARLNGTWTLSSKQQTANGDPFVSNLGRFVNDGVVQRWRHTISVDWESGPFSATLSNSYLSGYEDQNNAIDTETGNIVAANRVKAYSLWDLSGTWSPTKQLTLRAGVKNLLDTPPPFSNQAYFFISGYDPSYTDPRGRFVYLSANYKFK
ncbi:MAG: TonB-dependent receptor [Burkholderiales bacterium]|nr:TonB-dependent receptor [Burkholderiales bacterium]